ncbi:hypothetical protein RIF29_29043 [Crotalaria pallida]|uniref:Uncharacterized protein n=1 Tax=Crotalaria pallida TaxID=3830 RepID=A0AAN9EE94_CROPI
MIDGSPGTPSPPLLRPKPRNFNMVKRYLSFSHEMMAKLHDGSPPPSQPRTAAISAPRGEMVRRYLDKIDLHMQVFLADQREDRDSLNHSSVHVHAAGPVPKPYAKDLGSGQSKGVVLGVRNYGSDADNHVGDSSNAGSDD